MSTMEDASCVATAAERELARRSHILNRLIERSRALAKQDQQAGTERNFSSPTGFESETSLFYRASPRLPATREYEEDLKHLQSLRAEVEQIAKRQQQPSPATPKKRNDKCERKAPCGPRHGLAAEAPPQGRRDAKGMTLLVRSSSASDGVPRRDRMVATVPTAPKVVLSLAVSEANLAAVAAALKVRVKAADMPVVLQERAFRCARQCLDSMDKLNSKRVALVLKKEFDTSYGHAWHCIVGTSFGSFVTHSLGGFLYFSVDKVSILLFKTAVEPLGQ